MIRVSIVYIVLLCLIGCASVREYHAPTAKQHHTSPGCPTEVNSLCQHLLDSSVNEHGLVGAQISLYIEDDLICTISSGTTDLKRQQPMMPNHIIRLGSLTKTYTAIIIMRLMERGFIELDTPIFKWFPEYRFSERITVKMLSDHSSGIREILGPRVMFPSAIKSTRVWTTAELQEIIFEPKLEFEPGNDHLYSNSNYVLLGIIAERANGQPLKTLYREEIFCPLGIQKTLFLPCESIPPVLVTGHDRDLIPLPGWQKIKPDNTAWSSLAYASGAMAGTAPDVRRLFEAVMKREIISDESYRIMTTTTKAQNPEDKYLENFGLGLFKFEGVYRNTYGHIGLFVGSEAIALFDPEKRYVFVLLANVSRIKDRDTLIHKYLDLIENYIVV